MKTSWGMNTDLQASFNEILRVAIKNKVAPEDMPKHLLIFSDMEFDSAISGHTNYEVAKAKFAAAGYELPNIIFWNLNGRDGNSPIRSDEKGTALVSGFSTNICEAILKAENVTPRDIMLNAVMKDRYKVL